MQYLIIVLRLIHILSGVFWIGGSLVIGRFIGPAVAATADAGQKFLAYLITKAKISVAISVSAILTVLSGGALYWIDSQGFTSPWTTSGPGLGFGLGALFALGGLYFGLLVGKSMSTLGALAAEMTGPPSPGQMNKIQAAQRQLGYAGPISTAMQLLALISMATARYWRL